MDPFHIIDGIVAAGEAVITSLTVGKTAQVGSIAVAVHTMGLSFMAKEAGTRREWGTFALLAGERLQMGIHVLATSLLAKL